MPWFRTDKCDKSPNGKHKRAVMDQLRRHKGIYQKRGKCQYCGTPMGKWRNV